MASVSKNDGGAAKTRVDGESVVGKRALSDDELREALSREHPLAQLPALVMANIEDVPNWRDSTALVTAHSHAFVLHSDLPEALTSLRTERDLHRARCERLVGDLHDAMAKRQWTEPMNITPRDMASWLTDFGAYTGKAAEARALKAEASAWKPYDKFAVKAGDEVWVRARVTDNCTSCCAVRISTIHQGQAVGGYLNPEDVRVPLPSPPSESQ